MGDWGPSHFAPSSGASGPNMQAFRCAECGFPSPIDGTCSFCGGQLEENRSSLQRSAAAAAPARRTAPPAAPTDQTMDEATEAQVSQILSAILPPGLQDSMLGPAEKPTDEKALDELPLVKIEPYVAVRVTSSPPPGEATGSAATPSRELLADAAERRARGSSSAAASSSSDSATATTPSPPPQGPPPPLLEFRGTGSAFGTPLADYADDGVGSAPLVVASPRDGAADLTNAAELKGSIALMWRGGCSFVDKVRRAQKAGCAAAVVVQGAGQKWPFTMSDTAGLGGDLTLPSAMISSDDGEKLLDAMNKAAVAPTVDELLAEEMAAQLPCMHKFHEKCARMWLSKQHTCPTCRAPLPPKYGQAAAEDEADDEREPMATEAEWDAANMIVGNSPRRNAPIGGDASGMFS